MKPGFNVLIEKGAGMSSHFSDAEYESAGAKIVETEEVWKNSDIVMKVGYQMIYLLVQIVFIDLQHFRYCIQRSAHLLYFLFCHLVTSSDDRRSKST